MVKIIQLEKSNYERKKNNINNKMNLLTSLIPQ